MAYNNERPFSFLLLFLYSPFSYPVECKFSTTYLVLHFVWLIAGYYMFIYIPYHTVCSTACSSTLVGNEWGSLAMKLFLYHKILVSLTFF